MHIEPFYIQTGRLLYAARRKAGLSQDQVGARLSPPMKRATIANIETGKQRILAKTLVELADVFDVEISKLIPPKKAQQKRAKSTIHKDLKGALPNLTKKNLENLIHQIENVKVVTKL